MESDEKFSNSSYVFLGDYMSDEIKKYEFSTRNISIRNVTMRGCEIGILMGGTENINLNSVNFFNVAIPIKGDNVKNLKAVKCNDFGFSKGVREYGGQPQRINFLTTADLNRCIYKLNGKKTMFKLTNSEDIYLEENKSRGDVLLEGDNLKNITAIRNESGYEKEALSQQEILTGVTPSEIAQILEIVKRIESLSQSDRIAFLEGNALPKVVAWVERGASAVANILTIATNPMILAAL